jgi:DNA-binding LacI/PurR family transcriptional regulator
MFNPLELARLADVDPRTVLRFLDGQPVRPRLRTRIERALASMRMSSRTSKKVVP